MMTQMSQKGGLTLLNRRGQLVAAAFVAIGAGSHSLCLATAANGQSPEQPTTVRVSTDEEDASTSSQQNFPSPRAFVQKRQKAEPATENSDDVEPLVDDVAETVAEGAEAVQEGVVAAAEVVEEIADVLVGNWFLRADAAQIRALCGTLEDCKSAVLSEQQQRDLDEITLENLLGRTHPKCATEFSAWMRPPYVQKENAIAVDMQNREEKTCLYAEGFHLIPTFAGGRDYRELAPLAERVATIQFFASYFEKIGKAVKIPMIALHKELMETDVDDYRTKVEYDCRAHVKMFEDAGPVLHKMIQNFGEGTDDYRAGPNFALIRQELAKFKSQLRTPPVAAMVLQLESLNALKDVQFRYNATTQNATLRLSYPPRLGFGAKVLPTCNPLYEIDLDPKNRASIAVGVSLSLINADNCGTGDLQTFPAPKQAFGKIVRAGVQAKFDAEEEYVKTAAIGLEPGEKEYLLGNLVDASRGEFDMGEETEAFQEGFRRYDKEMPLEGHTKPLKITVPAVLANSTAVLVLDRAPGDTYTNLRNEQIAEGKEGKRVTDWEMAMQSYIQAYMVWQREACPAHGAEGFLHGDPHLGNILFATQSQLESPASERYSGVFSFIDFGIVQKLPQHYALCDRLFLYMMCFLEGALIRNTTSGLPDDDARWQFWESTVAPILGTNFKPSPPEGIAPANYEDAKRRVVKSIFAAGDAALDSFLRAARSKEKRGAAAKAQAAGASSSNHAAPSFLQEVDQEDFCRGSACAPAELQRDQQQMFPRGGLSSHRAMRGLAPYSSFLLKKDDDEGDAAVDSEPHQPTGSLDPTVLLTNVQIAAFDEFLMSYNMFEPIPMFLKFYTAFVKRWLNGYQTLSFTLHAVANTTSESEALDRYMQLTMSYLQVVIGAAWENIAMTGELAKLAKRSEERLPEEDAGLFRRHFLEVPLVAAPKWLRRAIDWMGITNVYAGVSRVESGVVQPVYRMYQASGRRMRAARDWMQEKRDQAREKAASYRSWLGEKWTNMTGSLSTENKRKRTVVLMV
ncbi:unnamed protein product [Amoebophrya sp. A120]|nr:unnamed protein product [Amoebophrya sp. A120]|eukprot:GSA120T00010403001.1